MCLLYTIWEISQDYLRPHHLEMTMSYFGVFYTSMVVCVCTYTHTYTPLHSTNGDENGCFTFHLVYILSHMIRYYFPALF